MTRAQVIQWGAIAGILGGVASTLEFIIFPMNAKVAEALLLAAYVLAAVGLVGFHALHGARDGRLGRAGLYTASSGSLLSAGAMVFALVAGNDLDLMHTIGASLLIVGYVLYGVAVFRANVMARWCGVAFMLVGPATFTLIGFGGSTTIVFGLFWIALGLALWLRTGTSSWAPSPIS